MFQRVERLKEILDNNRPLSKLELDRINEYFNIDMIYNSNAIEGNTLTLYETKMVIEQGLTIGEKGLRNYLEAINLSEAIEFVEDLINSKEELNERNLKNIHYLVLKDIREKNNRSAGTYRIGGVRISGSEHTPPESMMVPIEMNDLFTWYEDNKELMHPVELAAIFHLKLAHIHPFVDGNGRTSRLCMNFILMKYGYPPTILKADDKSKNIYYSSLEKASVTGDVKMFIEYITSCVEKTLMDYLDYLEVKF